MALFRKTRRFSPEFLRQLEARLRGHVEVLAGLIGPRHLDKPSSIEAAAAYIERQFIDIGDSVLTRASPKPHSASPAPSPA